VEERLLRKLEHSGSGAEKYLATEIRSLQRQLKDAADQIALLENRVRALVNARDEQRRNE
jgi:hypothetical protein